MIRKAMRHEPSIDWLLENQDKVQHYYHQLGLEGNSDWPDGNADGPLGAPHDRPFRIHRPGAAVLGEVHLGRDVSVRSTAWSGVTPSGSRSAKGNIQDLSVVHADPGVPCVVGRRATVGHRAILHGCTAGDGCPIGMGAILLNGVGSARARSSGPGRC